LDVAIKVQRRLPVSTNERKRLRAKLHNAGRGRKGPHRLRLLLPHHNMRADSRDD
jgi:hypothetical protein